MSRFVLFLVVTVAALASALLPGLIHGGIFHENPIVAAAQIATGFAFALALGYAAVGVVWLATWGRASRSVTARIQGTIERASGRKGG